MAAHCLDKYAHVVLVDDPHKDATMSHPNDPPRLHEPEDGDGDGAEDGPDPDPDPVPAPAPQDPSAAGHRPLSHGDAYTTVPSAVRTRHANRLVSNGVVPGPAGHRDVCMGQWMLATGLWHASSRWLHVSLGSMKIQDEDLSVAANVVGAGNDADAKKGAPQPDAVRVYMVNSGYTHAEPNMGPGRSKGKTFHTPPLTTRLFELGDADRCWSLQCVLRRPRP